MGCISDAVLFCHCFLSFNNSFTWVFWLLVYSLFGVSCVRPNQVREILACLTGGIKRYVVLMWRMLCLYVWSAVFGGRGVLGLIMELKSRFLNYNQSFGHLFLIGWEPLGGSISSFLFFLDVCNFRLFFLSFVSCTSCTCVLAPCPFIFSIEYN